MHESGNINRSAEEWLISRSPQRATFSKAVTACPLISLASPHTLSVNSGFLLCGMDDEPVCPSLNGSSTSLISVLCKPLISVAIFSRVAAIKAKVVMKCACLSLWIIWLDTGVGVSPSNSHTFFSISGGAVACVPTGPDIFPTEILDCAC